MNEKLKKVLLCGGFGLAFALCGFLAVNMVRLRQSNNELAERNRQLELSNTVYSNQLNAITDRIRNAQAAAQGAGDSIQRIKRIVSEIQAISLILRENSNPPSGNPSP